MVRRGQLLTSRDTGVLAAIGVSQVDVWRRPIVAILSTGDEIIAPGEPMQPSRVYDSNAQVLADAVRELGGEPRRLGIVPDDENTLRARLKAAIDAADIVLLSGGTSKGAGDVSYRVVAELNDPGIVAHGVALKPGKPICLASTGGKPVVVLPGFPTSAIFTFHEFVAPVLSALAGRTHDVRTIGAGAAGGEGEQRDRANGVPAGQAGRGRRRCPNRPRSVVAGRLPDGARLGKRDDVQPCRRVHDDRPSRRDRSRRNDRRRCSCWDAISNSRISW